MKRKKTQSKSRCVCIYIYLYEVKKGWAGAERGRWLRRVGSKDGVPLESSMESLIMF